jgi:PAS domain S-box-containing protein
MAALTFVAFRLHAGPAMAALLYFFLVILISLWAGFLPTALACAVAALCYVYFFTQPIYHLWMSEPVEIAATMAFSSTALIISRLLARVRERTAEVQRTNEQLQAEIAERNRAEERVRQSEAELHQLIDAIPQQVFVFDAGWSPLFANQREREYTGLTPGEAQLKDAVAKIFHPDDLKRLEVLRERALREASPFEMEARIRDKDGQYRWFLIRDNPLRDEQGRVLRWYGTRTDIEDRKRAEESQHRLNRELRALSECNQTLMRATDEPALLRKICRIVCEEAGYRVAWVGYAEPNEAKSVRPVAWTGTEEGDVANLGITWADTERGRGIIGTAIRSGKTCCIKDYATDPEVTPWRESALQHGFRSAIALPLKDEHANTFGSLNIYSAQPNAFASKEIRLLEELAGDLAFGIVTLRSRAARERAELALRQSEAYLAESQRLTHTGSWALDLASDRYVYVSEEDLRLWGFDSQMGLPSREAVFRRIHPEDRDKMRASFEKSLREKVDSSDGYRIVLPDGTVKHVHTIRHPVLNGAGDVVKLVGTSVDITERKQAEEALRESETRFRTFVDHAPDALFIFDFEQGTIVDVNRQACESLGYTRQELIGTMGLAFDGKVDRAVTESIAERTAAGETVIDTHWHQRKDGTLFPVEAHTSQYWYGGRRFLLKVARDITDRKRAQDELRRSEAYLAEGQRLSHAGSFAWSPVTLQSLFWSEEMFRIFGLNPQEGVPTIETFWQRIHPEDRDRTYELLLKAARGNMEYEHDHRILLPDGNVKHIHAIGHPVLGENGQVAEYVGTAVDVTDRKRAEEERERLRQLEADLAHIDRISMMGELAASVAHEVNQPLSGVVVNANACLRWLAGDSPNLEEAREAVRRIVRDGKRAGDVIARIRALATKTATAKERLDLNEAVREVVAFAGDELRKNRVAVRTEFAPGLSPVWGDRVQLQQVALNLVMNAIEAMSSVEDRPRELIVRTQSDEAGQVQVTVQDSGRGLDPQSLERIFEAFYTTKHGGMGMGLSISRSIIQNHGGKLWAVANEGPGISVQFTIPNYQ